MQQPQIGLGKWTFVFLPVGLILLAGALYCLLSVQSFLSTSVITTGTVIDQELGTDIDGVSYQPIITFRDQQNTAHTFVAEVYANFVQYPEGTTVEVIYNPQDISQAQLNSFWGLYLWPVLLGVLGVSLLGLSAIFYLISSKPAQQ